MRCPRCGNENSEGNRFCGMCGAPLIATAQPTSAATAHSRGEKKAGAAGGKFSDEPRLPSRPLPAASPEPAVTGPSFLGLNKPGDGQHSGQDRHGRSVDYLLEDDEEPKSGWGKLVLVLIALVLAGGFGYLHWRQGGFDWVLNGKKPAPAADSSSATPTPTATSNPAPSDSGITNSAAAPDAASGNSTTQPTASDNTTALPATPSASAGAPSANTPPPTSVAGTAAQSPAPENSAATITAVTPAAEASPEATSDDSARSESEETTKPAPSVKKVRKPTPATPVDVSAEAERYIYGRGVAQNCDRGLRLLKSAAQNDSKAMITMGVLYSSGTCAPRDLPTAYRWFAMALHKDPNNQALQDDLQQLWGQMTQPERQLAIKLSQ